MKYITKLGIWQRIPRFFAPIFKLYRETGFAVKNGEDLIEEIYRERFGLMANEIRKAGVSEPEVVKDLVQDSILRLIRYVGTLQALDAPQITVYVKKTAKSVAILYQRKQHTRDKYQYYQEESGPAPLTPEEVILQKEDDQRIDNILTLLPEFYQDLLIFRMMGIGKREACRILGIRMKEYDSFYRIACKKAAELYDRQRKMP